MFTGIFFFVKYLCQICYPLLEKKKSAVSVIENIRGLLLLTVNLVKQIQQ